MVKQGLDKAGGNSGPCFWYPVNSEQLACLPKLGALLLGWGFDKAGGGLSKQVGALLLRIDFKARTKCVAGIDQTGPYFDSRPSSAP